MEWVQEVLAHADGAGFVTAAPIRSLSGTFVAQGWTCEPFLAGDRVPASDLVSLRQGLDILHRTTKALPQRPGFLCSQGLLLADHGGDVDLRVMPEDVVALCRSAWRDISDRPRSVVHGDITDGNVLRCPDGRFALIDWDEARRDVTTFDLVNLGGVDAAFDRAHLAWEVACSWRIEPEYARRQLVHLRAMP